MNVRRRDTHVLSGPGLVLVVAVGLLLLIGVVMVYSASSVSDYVHYSDSAYHAKKQALYILAGILALGAISHWDFRLRKTRTASGLGALLKPEFVSWGVWWMSVAGLLGVILVGVGKWGATRSLDLGPVFIQPSEFAKLGCLLVTALLVTRWKRGELDTRTFARRLGFAVVVVVVLVMLQPDFGTTVSILAAVVVALWLGGVQGRWFAGIFGIGIPAGALVIKLANYRAERIASFLDPWADASDSGYQIIQSLYAFGSGGLFGVGLGLSRQKYFYLPAAHNDFIFAIIGEEGGLIASMTVVALFALFAWAGMRIAVRCQDPFGRVVAGGLTAMIVIQALMNMAAVTWLMPITGIPLPFVSAGGSSMILTLASVGVILAVHRRTGRPSVRLVRRADSRGSQSADSRERRRNGGTHLPGADGGSPTRRRGA